MYIVKTALLCFIGLLSAADLSAQASGFSDSAAVHKESLLVLGGGVHFSRIIDRGVSPHLYEGFGPVAYGGFVYRSVRHRHELTARYDYGQLNNTYAFSNTRLNANRVEAHYFYGHQFFELKSAYHKLYFGGAINNVWYYRQHPSFTNNSTHNDNYLSLALAVTYELHQKLWNREFMLSAHVFSPLFNYVIRPIYAATLHRESLKVEDPTFFSYITSGDFGSLNSYRGLSAIYTLEYRMLNRNKLRLSYQWSYRSNDGLNPIQMAEHGLTFSTLFNLRR